MTIKAVIFDFGGVIMNYSGAKSVWSEICADYNVSADLVHKILLGGGINAMLADAGMDLFKGDVSAHEVEGDHMIRVAKEHGVHFNGPVPLLSMWIGEGCTICYAERVLSSIHQLRAMGYKTALLTNNFHIDKKGLLKRTPIDFDLFDVVVESAVERTKKPEDRIYEICVERLSKIGVEPEECIFLDDLKENLEKAEKFGWKTILVDGNNPDPCVDQLEKELGVTFEQNELVQ